MTVAQDVRLPHALAAAVDRLTQASSSITELCRQSLALSALALPPGVRRDHAQEAHLVLSRASGLFQTEFARALGDRVRREWAPHGLAASEGPSSWDTWSLVDDQEIDRQVAAERFGRTIGQGCEWELRELAGYLNALTGSPMPTGRDDRQGMLRPEIISQAVLCALDALPASAEVRQLLAAELAATWAAHLPKTYALIIGECRAAGIVPSSMALRAHGPAAASRPMPASVAPAAPAAAVPRRGAGSSEVNAGLTQLLRTWTHSSETRDASAVPPDAASATGASQRTQASPGAAAVPNLIREHREELLRTLPSAVDHLIIDVVAALFEQILADPAVPAAVGQQIGRLQLPVLRTALADPTFFASRRHPVRQLINRLASLGLSLDELDDSAVDALVCRIRDLVHEIVHGDFEQLPLYERTLAELESFVAAMGREEIERHGAEPRLFAEREAEMQARLLAARRLRAAIQPLPAPGFLRDFITDVWSHVLLKQVQAHGVDGEATKQGVRTARDLFLSVQPKGSPEQRRDFVARLPHLIREVTAGLDAIQWPDAQRHDFFGQLMPAHAQSLRGEGLSTLDQNLLARQVEQALGSAIVRGTQTDARATSTPVPLDTASAPLFSEAEASVLGLLAEDQIDWSAAPHERDPARPAAIAAADLAIDGLPQPEAPEPTEGRALAEHVQVGYVYQMHLDGNWHKVRLMHVSPGRGFFVFARGRRHRRVISLTWRMLVRLCESGRLRALESAYLLERATLRARRQLDRISQPSHAHA